MENLYRERPRNPLILKQYINDLLEKEHILEASYYHEKLIAKYPNDIEANRLGYILAIRRGSTKIKTFEEKLYENNASQELIYSLQLFYYYTFNNNKNLKECLKALLDIEPTSIFTFDIALESTIILKDFYLTKKLIKNYLSLTRLTIKDHRVINELKPPLLSHLVNILKKVNKVE